MGSTPKALVIENHLQSSKITMNLTLKNFS
jgi:hypothetical protein